MKKWISFLLVWMLALSMTACGGEVEETEPETTEIPYETETETSAETEMDYTDYFIGSWEYADYDMFLEIYEDGTYLSHNPSGTSIEGTYRVEGRYIILSETLSEYWLNDDGNLEDKDRDLLLPFGANGRGQYDGYWLYDDGYVLEIQDNVWSLYDETGELYLNGMIDYDGSANLLNGDQSGNYMVLTMDEDGDVFEDGEMLTKLDEFPYETTETEVGEENSEGDLNE